MFRILIIAEENEIDAELRSGLARSGFACSVTPLGEEVMKQVAEQAPDLVLVPIDNGSVARELCQSMRREKRLPVIALVNREMLKDVDGHLDWADDFVIRPCDVKELSVRVKRLLQKAGGDELIRCGDLVIDPARYEVSLAGRSVLLTFKEYELLKFLVENKGRVFTREALLNKIWGYDYYGGDRTVDVHIRRLRSKIEDVSHSFIETVRNIGYRFCKAV